VYDTVNIRINRETATNVDFLAETPCYLENTTEHTKASGEVYISGMLQNYKVNVSQSGISLKGSLAKFYLGNNIETLTRGDTQKAIQKLSDTLHINVTDAKVNRFDIAANFIMKYDCRAYFEFLGALHHYSRLPQGKSLYYRNNLRQLIFYDKIAETQKKRQLIPDILKNDNVLRYEIRFEKRLPNQFKQPITARTLCNENFYIEIIDKWYNEYSLINKEKNIIFKPDAMNDTKEFEKQLILLGIEKLGGVNSVIEMIENVKRQGIYKNRMQPNRLKQKIKEIAKTENLTETPELINELSEKIKGAKTYYR